MHHRVLFDAHSARLISARHDRAIESDLECFCQPLANIHKSVICQVAASESPNKTSKSRNLNTKL